MTPLLAIQTFLICFNGQLYSTESDIAFSTSSRIVEINNAIDLKTPCYPESLDYKYEVKKKAKGAK